MNKKERTYYLDNLCCILILHMIYTCHIAYECGDGKPIPFSIISTVFSFFMSWFFYKGGMMHKEKPLKDILYKSYKRLLVPYLIFLFIGFVLDGVIKFSLYEHYSVTSFIKEEFITVIKKSVLHPTAVSWFLLSLFVVRLVFNYCCTRIHSLILVLLFAGLATGINFLTVRGCVFDMNLFGHDFCINVPFYIGNMCHGLSLYSLGYYLKEKQYQKLFFYLALMLFVMKFFIPAGLDFRANDSGESNFVLAVIYGMAGCVVANNIFRYCFDFNVPFMTYIGQIQWFITYVITQC